jgi:uncharacterized membrane protein YgdD (TMEM256/DUF423 family)
MSCYRPTAALESLPHHPSPIMIKSALLLITGVKLFTGSLESVCLDKVFSIHIKAPYLTIQGKK